MWFVFISPNDKYNKELPYLQMDEKTWFSSSSTLHLFCGRVYVLFPPTRFLHDDPHFYFRHPSALSPTQFWVFVELGNQKNYALGKEKKSWNHQKQYPYVF